MSDDSLSPDEPSLPTWYEADFSDIEPETWPVVHTEIYDRWMCRQEDSKAPVSFAANPDDPVECSESGHSHCGECECDARFKWGSEGSHQYVHTDFETARDWSQKDPRLSTDLCYIQSESDPFGFIDGDDVRDPETGHIHPTFIEIARRLGLTYADVSTSGSGAHLMYRGEIPLDGVKDAAFEIDDEPWGSNDDCPAVEIYARKRVCVMTGKHVRGTGTKVNRWDEDELEKILEENGISATDTSGSESKPLPEDFEPNATTSNEGTDDIRDIKNAIDGLDAQRVAEQTIVHRWNDSASTSSGMRAFHPTWGPNSNGTANVVDSDKWFDSGGNGQGGPVMMSAIDCSELSSSHRDRQADLSTDDWWTAVEHLRDLGFDIPKWVPDQVSDTDPADGMSSDGGVETGSVSETPTPNTDETGIQGDTEQGSVSEPPTPTPDTDEPTVQDETEQDTSLSGAVARLIEKFNNDENMSKREIRHKVTRAILNHRNFIYPKERVRGWRTVLYRYDSETGLYLPDGDRQLQTEIERVAGELATNQFVSEVTGKVKRLSTVDRRGPFDRAPHRLVVGNGILNLHTGELEPHTPDEYHETGIQVDWNPDADDPDAIRDFLSDIVEPGDVPTLIRLMAHSLYKRCIDEKAAILLGSGENGKSVFVKLLESFLDPAADNVSGEELEELDKNQFSARRLRGKLANMATELGEQELDETKNFRKLTGQDTMSADVKYESPISFENHATMIFASNEMPVFSQDNHAIWRRWLLIEFPYTFSDELPDAKEPADREQLLSRMTTDEQLEGLLLLCQQEIERWKPDGPDGDVNEEFFADAAPVPQVREKMKKAAEPVFAFTAACLEPADKDDAFLLKDRVRRCYQAFADEEDVPNLMDNEFGDRLVNQRDMSLQSNRRRIDGQRKYVYEGVQFTPRGRQLLGEDAPDDQSQAGVADMEGKRGIVMSLIREISKDKGRSKIPKNAVEYSPRHDIEPTDVAGAIQKLATQGEIIKDGDDWIVPTEFH
jgi:P4 family phage/plasmid primase-like protien